MLSFKQNISPVRLIFFTSLIFLAAMTVFSYKKNIELVEQAGLVNHTNVVKYELENLFSDIKDAEGGARAFYLTGIPDFLNSLQRGKESMVPVLKDLDSLLYDNPKQVENLNWLKGAIKAKNAFLDSEVLMKRSIGYDTAVVMRSKADMNEIRARINMMMHEEERLLRERTSMYNSSVSFAPTVTVVLAASCILLLVFSYFKIANELQKSTELQKELAESNIVLEKSNSELSQFAYVASHDLQEPLRKIQTFISRIYDTETNLSEKGKDYFSRVDNSAKRMQQLIRDILAYSRINKADSPIETTNLNEVFSSAKEQLEEFIREKNAVVKADALPAVKAVKYQMEQMFVNLISNALKFSKEGVQNIISAKADKVSGADVPFVAAQKNIMYHRIIFADNGIGFEPQYGERIFRIFHRLNAKESYEGNGIGLSIVQKIIDAHRGFIKAEGDLGKGAVFTIYLPV